MGVRTGGSEQQGEPLLAASLPSCFASACSSTFSFSLPYRSIRSISCGAPLADAAASRCLPAHSLFQKNRLLKRQPRVRNSSCAARERPGVAHVKESSATVATNAAAPPVATTPVGKAAVSHVTAPASALAELPGSAAASSTSGIPAVAAKTGAGGIVRTRAAATVRRTAATIAGAATALGKAAAAAVVSTPLTAAATPGYAPLTSNTRERTSLAPALAPAAETLPAAATATQAKAVVTAAVASTLNIPSNCLLTRWRTSLAFSDLPVAAAVRVCTSEPGSTIGFSPAGTTRRERQPLRRQEQEPREHEFHAEQQQRQPRLQRPEKLHQRLHKQQQWGQELQQGHTGFQQQKEQEEGDHQQELGTQWPRKRQMKHKTVNRKQQQQQRITGEMPHRQQNTRLQQKQRLLLQGQPTLQKQRQHQASITALWMLAFVCFCGVVLLHPVTAAAALFHTVARRDLSRKSARNPLCSSAAIPVSAAAAASLLPSLPLRPCASPVLQQHESQQQQLEQHHQLRQQQWQRRKARLHASQHQRQLSDSEKETAGRPSRAEKISPYTHQELLSATTSPSSSSSPPRCSALAACPAAAASSPLPGLSTAAVHFMDPSPQRNSETGGAATRWSVRTLHATEPAGEGVGGGSSLRTAQKRLLKQRRLAACSGVRTPCTFLRQQKPITPAPPSPTALQLVHLAATPSFDYFFLSASLPRDFVRVPFYSGALSRSTAAHAAVPSDAFRSNCLARAATPSSAAGRCRTRAAPSPAASVTSRAATGIPGAALRAAALPTPQFTAAPTGARAAATAAGQPTTGGNGEAGTGAEVFHFQAEVKRVLDIIVNSLYTDRDVFLRELISNAADACDKKRVLLQQQTPQQQQQQEQQEQQRRHQSVFRGSIRVRADREKNTLSIEDDGIGMTRAELISNLGTIAQSGTYRFLEQLRKEQAAASPFSAQKGSPASSGASLIGQFGVGFYSAFLVANKVEVYSAPWRRERGRAPAATAAAGGNAATEAAEAAKRAAATKGEGEDRAARDAAAVEEGELELWKWTSTCGQTFQLERVADAAAERRRWLEEGRALRAQFQKQKQQQRLQQEGGAAEAGKQDGEKKDAEEEEEEDLSNWSGTRVVLHLKEDCDDYLEDYKLKELLRKYSEFVQLPIYIWSERIEYERVPDTQEAPGLLQQQRSSSSGGGVGRGEDVGGKAGEPAFSQLTPETMDEQLEHMQQQQRQGLAGDGAAAAAAGGSGGRFKTVTRRYYEWEHLNTQPPIWRRDEATLSDKDYVDFYKSTFKAYDDPLSFVHMKVEGQVEFNALLFVPGALPWELARNMFDEDSRGIRLYVKRVFINDKFADAVPRWLTFIRGVVDSDELPLNVGREILQKSRMLQVINKRLAMKAVEMIKKIKADGGEKWRRFWENYGKYLKVGAVEDKDNQEELASLVQFHSTASPHALTDLSSYISRMQARNAAVQRGEPASSGGAAASAAAGRLLQPRQQQAIYYLAAENRRAAEESPALELPKALGYEVIFGTEPLDEFFLASLSINQYKGFQVVDVNKADLKLGAEKAEDSAGDAAATRDTAAVGKHSQRGEPQLEQHDLMKQESIEAKRIQLGSLCEWLQQILGSRVHRVQITDRLFSSPAVLVQGDFGLSPTMQRYMKQQAAAQGVSEQELYGASLNQPILELNPYHPIVQRLDVLVRRDVTDSKAKEVALQLFDVASLQGGYTIENPGQFAKRIVDMMKNEADAALS